MGTGSTSSGGVKGALAFAAAGAIVLSGYGLKVLGSGEVYPSITQPAFAGVPRADADGVMRVAVPQLHARTADGELVRIPDAALVPAAPQSAPFLLSSLVPLGGAEGDEPGRRTRWRQVAAGGRSALDPSGAPRYERPDVRRWFHSLAAAELGGVPDAVEVRWVEISRSTRTGEVVGTLVLSRTPIVESAP